MNRNRSSHRNAQNPRYSSEKKMRVKVTRCNVRQRPVFEHETCTQFASETSSPVGTQSNCKNCSHSF